MSTLYGDAFTHGKLENTEQWSVASDGLITCRVTLYFNDTGYTSGFDPATLGFNGGWGDDDGPIGLCIGGAAEQMPNNTWKVVKVYAGINSQVVTWKITSGTNQEPIESHINWSDGDTCDPAVAPCCEFGNIIGGTGDKPVNQAQFKGRETKSKFDYFPTNATCDLEGVRAYLDPTCQIEKTTLRPHNPASLGSGGGSGGSGGTDGDFDPDWDSVSCVGAIFEELDYAPDVPAGRTWLMMGSTQEVIGGAIRIRETYRLSGRKGWNTLIYETCGGAGSGGSS